MTALFCDLVGFTATSEAADPEDVDRMLAAYFAMARGQIEAFGGIVEKFIGDAVVGVFGVPAAHEDDPERAVRAALRIAEDADGLRSVGDAPLRLRVGINTGEALVRVGVAPGVRRALPDRGCDQHRVADPVGRARDGCRGRPGDLRGDRGRSSTTTSSRPPRSRARPSRCACSTRWRRGRGWGPTSPARHETPFIGREIDLALLKGLFDKTVATSTTAAGHRHRRAGSGQEPDRGRAVRLRRRATRPGDLAAGTLPAVRRGDHLLGARRDPEGARRHPRLGRPADGDGEARGGRSPTGPSGRGSASGSCRCSGSRLHPPREREELFTAWRRFLEGIADERPAVLVFEDLHWADEALLAFLEHLADRAEGVPLLVIGTARPELFERHPDFGRGLRNATSITLRPLSPEETARFVSALLGAAIRPAALKGPSSSERGAIRCTRRSSSGCLPTESCWTGATAAGCSATAPRSRCPARSRR